MMVLFLRQTQLGRQEKAQKEERGLVGGDKGDAENGGWESESLSRGEPQTHQDRLSCSQCFVLSCQHQISQRKLTIAFEYTRSVQKKSSHR